MKLRGVQVPYEVLAGLSFTALPYSSKIIPGIFCDSIYSDKIGKRKTWILCGQSIMTVSALVFYFKFEHWLVVAGQEKSFQSILPIGLV